MSKDTLEAKIAQLEQEMESLLAKQEAKLGREDGSPHGKTRELNEKRAEILRRRIRQLKEKRDALRRRELKPLTSDTAVDARGKTREHDGTLGGHSKPR